jgi:hypothetical protein
LVIVSTLWEIKTPMAWAAERFDRHHAIGAYRSGIKSCGRTAATANQATRPAVQTGVIRGIPVQPERREVNGIVLIVIARTSQRARACRPMPFVGIGLLKVEAPAANEVDRFAQGGRHGGEKLFISVKGHRHTPSP